MKNTETRNQPTNDAHRLKAMRLREGISLRSLAKRMNVTVSQARSQEEGHCDDLRVSDLYRWQRALKVPLPELLEPPKPALSDEVRHRACLVRVAKTAKSLARKCSDGSEHRLACRIVDQLHELMPELKEIGAWPEGRPAPQLGRAASEISMREWMLPELD
jgi:transcriptional regulator with XRE-family HTH domain